MSILIYDPFAGISGDMHMGAMVDLGVPEEYLLDTLKALNLPGWKIRFTTEQRQGISASRAIVETDDRPAVYEEHHHGHEHDHHHHHHEHEHEHNHEHEHEHEHEHTHDHEHRTLVDIRQILSSSDIPASVKALADKIFLKVAEAEGKVHGKPLDEVHFHEVGAIDSIVDIVAAAAALDYLKPEKIFSFPPQLGGGFVRCAHGRMPVPAPATSEILTGIPSRLGAADYEMTTPTGAAILAAVVDQFIERTDMVAERVGYGAGTRDGEIPNVLRVYLADETGSRQHDEVIMIETSIDDMNPELYEYVTALLRDAGVKDLWLSPVQMKKGRPGTVISVMCLRSMEEQVSDILFTETTTGGLRIWPIEQKCLERDELQADTPYGTVRVKRFYRSGKLVSQKPEYEDMKRLARENNISLRQLYREIEL